MTARTAAAVGATVGALAVGADAFRPLLMPRPTVFQGGLTAIGAANGAVVGAVVGVTADAVTRGRLVRAARRRPVVAGAAGAATLAWTVRLVMAQSRAAAARLGPQDPSPAKPLPAAAIGWGGVLAAVAALRGVAAVTAAAGDLLSRRTPVPAPLWSGALRTAVAATAVVGVRRARGVAVARALADSRRVEPGFAPPASSLVSGGPGSAVPFELLGREGRRFVASAMPASTIAAVTGTDAVRDPIRVFVGYDCAGSEAERVELAMAELDRTGAFDRAVLCVQCPAGTGYANSTPIEALELYGAGDVATVVVGYGLLPSVMSVERVPAAARTQWLLLEALARRRAAAAGAFPRLVLYGESLGALAQQQVFVDRGTVGLDDLGVDAALWVGSPARALLPRQLLGPPRPDVDPALVTVIDRPEQIPTVLASGPPPRFWFLHHDADPVTRFEPAVAWRRPAWMAPGAPRGRGVPDDLRWRPVMTWWALMADTLNATNVAPGDFRSSGHDYRADLAATVRAAYRLGDVPGLGDGVDSAAVEAALRAAERHRGVLAGEVPA